MMGLLALAGNLLATALPTANHSSLKVSLSGTVIADAGEPLEYATVSAFTTDSTLLDGTVTDNAGEFELQLPKGEYRLKIEFIGFEAKEFPVTLTGNMDMGQVNLTTGGLTLDAVEVRAEKSQMNLLLDKKVFNVGQDALSRGGSANEVLEQLPSVTVSQDGAVSLRGNSGVRILINGRPSALANNNALEGIPADGIESVEIITNPSAKYESEGTAGIINIILKKSVNKGYGGTAGLRVGYPGDYRVNLNLNLRREKFNAFANVGGRFSEYLGTGDQVRKSTLNNNFSRLDQAYRQERVDLSGNGFFGFDYNFTPKDVLTASYSIYHQTNDDIYTTAYDYTDAEGDALNNSNQYTDYFEPGTYHQMDLTYVKTLKTEDEKLNFYFKSDQWSEPELEDISITESFPNTDELRYRTETQEGSKDYLLQADYETKIGEHTKLEIGGRGETRIIRSDYLAELREDGEWNPLPGFQNELRYYERIGAAYAQLAWEKDKLGIQAGVRSEYTFVRTETTATPELDGDRDYNRLFPSASGTYKFSEAVSTQLSYSSRIRRPYFGLLNPFGGIGDPNSIFVGNPQLNPIYIDRLEWNLVYRSEKLTINPAIYVAQVTDFFATVINQVPENAFGLTTGTIVRTPVNLDTERFGGIELSINYRPTDNINLSADGNFYGYEQRGNFEGRSFDQDFSRFEGGLRASVDLPNDLNLQSSLQYRSPYRDVQTTQIAQYYWTTGISKQYNKKVTITFNISSPRIYGEDQTLPNFTQTDRGQWTRWRSNLNVQYRFEKGAGARERRQRGSIR